MHADVAIPRRFCGPPDSANGGYTAGLLAGCFDGPVEVTLRRPPPLERVLALHCDHESAELRDGDVVVAEAAPAALALDAPAAVHPDDARRAVAEARPAALADHPFPTCFVCGPARGPGDGLGLLPGRVAGRDVFASPWTPAHEHADVEGLVRPEVVWAALDCPSSFAMYMEEDPLPGPYVLGRITARVERRPRAEEEHVVVGFRTGVDGRKLFAGSALYDAAGTPLAVARATWIRV